MNKILIAILMAFLLAFASCENFPQEDIQVAIMSVKGTASISLDDRTDWSLLVNENEYNTYVKGRTIQATPHNDAASSYYTIYGSHTKDSLPNIKQGSLRLLFAAPNYPFKDKVTIDDIVSEPTIQPAVEEVYDQSSYEKIKAVDALLGTYNKRLSPYIENVKLEHRHNRLNFRIEGLPQGGKMRLMCNENEIKPYVHEGVSSAVLIYTKGTHLEVEANGKIIELPMWQVVKQVTPDKRVSRDIFYQLLLMYDAELEQVDYELTAEKWSLIDMTPTTPTEDDVN